MPLYPPEFEARTIDQVRRLTDDIAECESAEISVVFNGDAPSVEFIFGQPCALGRPHLQVQMVAESRKNPLAPGRLLSSDELRRHVRDSIERYFKLCGHTITRKVMQNVSL